MHDDPPSPIPMLDLSGEIDALWDDLNAAVQRVLRSGRFVLGPEVEAFEGEVAAYLGVKHAVGLNSGTDALVIGLRALGVGPGDEVITTPFSFFATAESILAVGAKPVFVDIRADGFNLDPALVEGAIGERTKAILPVHLYGNPAAMTTIVALAKRHGLKILEDCAQSFGAVYRGEGEGDATPPDPALVGKRTGALGDAGAFSFYPTKNLGAYGDGGLLTTDDDEVARLARMLRNHGSATRYDNVTLGYNSRLDTLQAAILQVKLPHLERWNAERRAAAARYGEMLSGVPGLVTPSVVAGHVFHQYTVRVPAERRDALVAGLAERGVSSVVYYPKPQHRLVAVGMDELELPVSERAAAEVLSLPLWPGMSAEVQGRVAEALGDLLG